MVRVTQRESIRLGILTEKLFLSFCGFVLYILGPFLRLNLCTLYGHTTPKIFSILQVHYATIGDKIVRTIIQKKYFLHTHFVPYK